MGKLDQGAIDRVRDEAWPRVENADELHDALVELGFLTEPEASEWQDYFTELKNDRRAAVLHDCWDRGRPARTERAARTI